MYYFCRYPFYIYIYFFTRDKSQIQSAAARVKTEVGEVNILINNAGVVSGKKLLDTPDVLVQRTFDVNLLAHFWVS